MNSWASSVWLTWRVSSVTKPKSVIFDCADVKQRQYTWSFSCLCRSLNCSWISHFVFWITGFVDVLDCWLWGCDQRHLQQWSFIEGRHVFHEISRCLVLHLIHVTRWTVHVLRKSCSLKRFRMMSRKTRNESRGDVVTEAYSLDDSYHGLGRKTESTLSINIFIAQRLISCLHRWCELVRCWEDTYERTRDDTKTNGSICGRSRHDVADITTRCRWTRASIACVLWSCR